ncbi:MBL fold metallo-hydrolase [Metallumcola ferriviriculae]|uniref:MBL fold metallo-hydrolase n=1 Tax=Metallumcola ferriviriculae TaxID=3039180 RepID=A0AAU0UP77_9FIRM|nr:MBL fold metallo-hydrolase [Desulfitibacteraceae bacterium MK1]
MTIVVARHNGIVYAKATVKLFTFRLNVFTYLADGVLVDTGPGRFSREYLDFFKSRTISRAVITHHHEDHSGNAKLLTDIGIPVYAHESAHDLLQRRALLPFYRYLFWGKRQGFRAIALAGQFSENNCDWEAVAAPGHASDHVVLLNRNRGAVFTGDLVVTPRPKGIFRFESIPKIIASLKTLNGLDYQDLYCAHAGPVKNGREMVNRKIDYLENLMGKIIELSDRGWPSRAIANKLFPNKQLLTYFSIREWDSEHLVRSVLENR